MDSDGLDSSSQKFCHSPTSSNMNSASSPPNLTLTENSSSEMQYDKETKHFFLALKMLGPDFFLMAKLLPNKNYEELKEKFSIELVRNPNLLEEVLKNREPLNEEKLRAGPPGIDVGNMDFEMEPDSDKTNLGKATRRKKSSKKRPLEKGQTPQKRKAALKQTDDSVATTGPPEKKLEIGKNPSIFLPVPQKVVSRIIPRICNIFSTFNLGSKIDLKSVMLTLLNAEYHPSLSSRVTLRLAPKTTARVYRNGKVDCIGTNTLDSAQFATRRCADLIKACGFPLVKFLNYRVKKIFAIYKTNFLIDLEELTKNNSLVCGYEPELFPGAKWEMEDPKLSLIIFTNGSIILTGGKTMKEVCKAYKEIFKVVENYKK